MQPTFNDRMRFHHVGCIVDNIEQAVIPYKAIFHFTNIGKPVRVEEQKVVICFIEINNGVFLELIQPDDGNSTLAKWKKKGIRYYHLGYSVDDLERLLGELLRSGYFLVSDFHSEAFGMKRCVFVSNGEMDLMELIANT